MRKLLSISLCLCLLFQEAALSTSFSPAPESSRNQSIACATFHEQALNNPSLFIGTNTFNHVETAAIFLLIGAVAVASHFHPAASATIREASMGGAFYVFAWYFVSKLGWPLDRAQKLELWRKSRALLFKDPTMKKEMLSKGLPAFASEGLKDLFLLDVLIGMMIRHHIVLRSQKAALMNLKADIAERLTPHLVSDSETILLSYDVSATVEMSTSLLILTLSGLKGKDPSNILPGVIYIDNNPWVLSKFQLETGSGIAYAMYLSADGFFSLLVGDIKTSLADLAKKKKVKEKTKKKGRHPRHLTSSLLKLSPEKMELIADAIAQREEKFGLHSVISLKQVLKPGTPLVEPILYKLYEAIDNRRASNENEIYSRYLRDRPMSTIVKYFSRGFHTILIISAAGGANEDVLLLLLIGAALAAMKGIPKWSAAFVRYLAHRDQQKQSAEIVKTAA